MIDMGLTHVNIYNLFDRKKGSVGIRRAIKR